MKQASSVLAPYIIKACRPTCPNAVLPRIPLTELEQIIRASGWPEFLNQSAAPIRHHDQFKIAVSACPNGCVQPHIVDFGLIATAQVDLDPDKCHECGLCIKICREQALQLVSGITLNPELCLGCLACVRVCPTQALSSSGAQYRVLLGGKLGRHPRLAHELGQFAVPQILTILKKTLALSIKYYHPRRRLAELIEHMGVDTFNTLVQP